MTNGGGGPANLGGESLEGPSSMCVVAGRAPFGYRVRFPAANPLRDADHRGDKGCSVDHP